MSENITLSVTVLSYNNEQYIEDCLTSIERQGIDSYEVFIVDDCSKDNSVSVIREFIKDRPQFTLIEKEKNSGGAISSQIGVARSRGTYCAIIDSDDIVADGAFKRLISRIEEDGSDFAAGMPLRFISGYMFTYLANEKEKNVFCANRVLEGIDKIIFSNQVYYWNSVYRTDFLKDNDIHMPSGLLIADRVFIYDAIYKAKKISVDNSIVYYWRQKNNPDKPSIMDIGHEYVGIADRCDSFDAQIRVTLENTGQHSEYNIGMWERSVERLFYPLDQMLELEEDISKDFIYALCERYRLLLCEYKAFFLQLIDAGNIETLYSYFMINILEKRYDKIVKLVGLGENRGPVMSIIAEEGDILERKALSKEALDFSVRKVTEEGDHIYMYVQVGLNVSEQLHIDKITAVSRYYKMCRFDLEYDNDNNRFDISSLPESTYNFIISYSIGKSRYMQEFGKDEVLGVPTFYKTKDYIITSSLKGGNPFTKMRRSRYTLLKDGKEMLIYVNQADEDIDRMFFYNNFNNEKTELEEISRNLYRLDPDALPEGSNMLLARHKDKTCSTISRYQMTNNNYQLKEFRDLFMASRIEVVK